MIVNDITYGKFEIDGVLEELVKSKPLQRLKKVQQYGIPPEFYTFPGFSRYDHSIGVMLLLKKLNASVEEQATGLLHDVSHTAFSHVVDWVLNNRLKEDYHDSIQKDVVMTSGIGDILVEFGLKVDRITDKMNFSLLERDEPDLCADRVDYALKEFHYWADPMNVKTFVDNLTSVGNKIVFKSKNVAEMFGKSFMKCQNEHWGGAQATVRYQLFSKVLLIALENGIIKMEDLNNDDDFVMKKLVKSNEVRIKRIFKILSSDLKIEIDEKTPQLKLRKKFRYVDPWYMENNEVYRLSEQDEEYENFLEMNRELNKRGINVRLSVSIENL